MTVTAPARERGLAVPGLTGIDHVEWWVGNARHSAGFFSGAFGFEIVAHAGPETGAADRTSYVLEQGDIRFVVTSPLTPDSDIARHVLEHGDGVRALAFAVEDVESAYEALVARGAPGVVEPFAVEDGCGTVHRAAIAAYGDTDHVLVDRRAYRGAFAPGFEHVVHAGFGPAVGLRAIDHVVANVERGRLDEWVAWYERVFGFGVLLHFDEEQISTEHSALRSTVVWDGAAVKLPINEPADGLRRSQIQEFLDYYRAPGVQHLALATPDIVRTVSALRRRGVRFLDVPPAYYEEARGRMAGIDLPWDDLEALGILVDRDRDGHLLQVFTETVASRPTVFLEIIQRDGAEGFGEGNFKALFEAIEREQARRGNL
jgi:4-hydroxyphenylpyruvate dioxygenase